ncbi:universal stress protein [Chroococcus sp. FPU101]|uniref:universal stress protein n=1 Tax=Chroococcus sp. FPU101 TaxID=1974212 RepID=UPI001A8E5E40|nr:universal stress protein [Chroococcus sp. FPU101]GFE71409.1 hypothetical protein CFPU101_40190 [Chroococcus sp. FPU101]
MFQRILVAVDQSEIGVLTFKVGVDLVKSMNAQMMLIHVITPITPGYLNPVFPMPGTMFNSGECSTVVDRIEDVTFRFLSNDFKSLPAFVKFR